MALLTLLAFVTLAIVRQRSLFGVIVLFSIYSFLMASVLVVLDAVDVAMTEASVGAGISTVIFLASLHLIKTTEIKQAGIKLFPLLLSIVTGAGLVWGTMTLPPFGHAENPIHQHVAPHYLENSIKETTVPNVVTSVLADYRGYDTLGETTVIFTAGIGVMLLLRGLHRRRRAREQQP
jgi:multicomponent Na+:H+ antiporter subunit B